jgi:spore germination protein PE
MFSRISKVGSLSVKTLVFSSSIQIGDYSYLDASTDNFAVQREAETFFGNEGDCCDDPIYHFVPHFLQINEPFIITSTSPNPFIMVNNINIIGVTASSIIGIGNMDHVRMRAAETYTAAYGNNSS